ncbi:hypothetical protein BDV27DRAFT_146661 [Aspergillus caelatus]|uniref:Uncharacterized protein n=1 Tax=Aspergillus caelatus TaxID=61420 RepID=A0A5N7A0T2_9EURO|nr:uncharacterized protein BDV27DRAFT_146661 [Aspergillus caelatus]KAE8362786.1 hypothetical protein BDV27DRAFT_146661 [Aspergillus caelatus]
MFSRIEVTYPKISSYHVVSQGDDNELRVLRSFFDLTGLFCRATRGYTYVSEVQCGINFVHDIQWCRLVMFCVTTHCNHLVHLLKAERDDAKAFHESIQSSGSKAVKTSFSTVARCKGSIEIRRTSFVEVNRGVLRLLFQSCNSSFQRLLIHL